MHGSLRGDNGRGRLGPLGRLRSKLAVWFRHRVRAVGCGGRRSRGGFMGRTGIDLFIEDGAYTTLSSAVAMLVVLTLVFSCATAVWSMSRAGDTQVAADTGALAGANVVSSYHTAATVVDASILSLGLTGFAAVGVGLVAMLVPGVQSAASKTVDAGIEIIKTRNKFAKSAAKGLEKLEGALPYLVAARATQVVGAQGTDDISYAGTALAVPRTSGSDFDAIEGSEIATDAVRSSAEDLDRAAKELAKAQEKTAAKKEAAWREDCGSKERNKSLWERAKTLANLPGSQNPFYESSITWEPKVALDRAKAYYRYRLANEAPEGAGVNAKANSAARKAFYRYAIAELDSARIFDDGTRMVANLPLLPRNLDEVRACELYTDEIWPTSENGGQTYIHYGTDCPGYRRGTPGVQSAVCSFDGLDKCADCHFGASSLAEVAKASSVIGNGFEYHFDKFKDALEDYVDARNRELELERQTEDEADRAGSAFTQAIEALSAERPRIAPPGRNGVIAFAVSGETSSPDELATSFNQGTDLGTRGAISAAVLAPDEATDENNVLSEFFSSIEERTGGGGVAGLLNNVMGLWGKLLVGYGDIQKNADSLMRDLLGGLSSTPLGPIASWLDDTVSAAVAGLGLQPADLRLRKPVLTDTANVAKSPGSDIGGMSQVQDRLRKIPLGVTDPQAIAQALEYQIEKTIAETTFTIAEIPLPGGGSIPLTVDLSTIAGVVGGGS